MAIEELTVDEREENRESWAAAFERHKALRASAAVLVRGGGEVVDRHLRALLGDIGHSRILQPFCNDGRELLALTMEEEATGLGIDFCSAAISEARRAARELNSPCRFVCDEVNTWMLRKPKLICDLAFTSLGSLCWLSNLKMYFEGLHQLIRSGGKYALWDFHPLLHCFNDSLELVEHYPEQVRKRRHQQGVVDYVGEAGRCVEPGLIDTADRSDFRNPHAVTEMLWSMAEIIDSAVSAGWMILHFQEYLSIPSERYLKGLIWDEANGFVFPPARPALPLTFGLVLQH